MKTVIFNADSNISKKRVYDWKAISGNSLQSSYLLLDRKSHTKNLKLPGKVTKPRVSHPGGREKGSLARGVGREACARVFP